MHLVRMNSLMSSTTRRNTPQGLSAVVADHNAVLASLGFYLAPVEAGLHGFSLPQGGDFGLNLQLWLACCRLGFELAANVVLLEGASHCGSLLLCQSGAYSPVQWA
jgi:hypothetical protein